MSEIWVILLIVVILFGGSQIPKLAKSLGRARKEFQEGIKDGEKEVNKSDNNDASTPDKQA